MERMTEYIESVAGIRCEKCLGLYSDCDCEDCLREVVKRLAVIETILGDDYDLNRIEEVLKKQEEYEQFIKKWKNTVEIAGKIREIGAERLSELVEADRDGRCVVLPAKMGDDVWLIVTKRPRVTMPEFSFVKHSRLTWTNIERVVTEFGKTVFRTPEAAQKALERMKSNG